MVKKNSYLLMNKYHKIKNDLCHIIWKIPFSHLFWLDSHIFCRSDFKQNKFECDFSSYLHIYHSNLHVQLRRVTTKARIHL